MELEKLKESYLAYRKNSFGWQDILNDPDQDWFEQWLEKILILRNAEQNWSAKTNDQGNYQTITKTYDPPALEAGLYLVLAGADQSFKVGSSLMQACFLNVTDLVLVGTAGVTTKTLSTYHDLLDHQWPNNTTDDVFRFYTLSAKTGQAVSKTALNSYTQQNSEQQTNLLADEQGRAILSASVDVHPESSNYWQAYPLAKSVRPWPLAAQSSDQLDYRNFNVCPPTQP